MDLFQNKLKAAGVSLVIGLAGSIVGLVYGWSLALDKSWFLVWFVASCVLMGLFVWQWYRSLPTEELRTSDTSHRLEHDGAVTARVAPRSELSDAEAGQEK